MILFLLLACGIGGELRAGDAALNRSDLDAAESAYRAALAKDPQSAEALYGLGWTYHLAGQRDAARDAFQQCVRVHPESPLGYKGLGSVAMAEGQPAGARKQFELALERSPGDHRIRMSLALLDLSNGRHSEALAALDALIAEDPHQAEFQQARAEALLQLDRDDDALASADRAIELAGVPTTKANAHLSRARCLLALTGRRVDEQRCAETAPPVYAWLDEADRALDAAEATGVRLPALVNTRKEVRRRRGLVDDQCPGLRGG